MTDELQNIWHEQEEEGLTMSTNELALRAHRFESRIRRRNWIEYSASALVIGTFGWMAAIVPDTIVKTGCLAMIAGVLVIVRNLRHYGPAPAAGAKLAADCRAFYRGELVRQRDALQSVTRWYLAPLVPGMLLFEAGMAHALAAELPPAAVALTTAMSLAIVVAVFAGVRWLNLRAARRLDADIARIDQEATPT